MPFEDFARCSKNMFVARQKFQEHVIVIVACQKFQEYVPRICSKRSIESVPDVARTC